MVAGRPGSDGGVDCRRRRCKQHPGGSISEHARTRFYVELAEGFANDQLTNVRRQSERLRKSRHLVGNEEGVQFTHLHTVLPTWRLSC